MSRDASGIVTGLGVLITGVIAAVNLIGPADPLPVENTPSPFDTVTVGEPAAEASPTGARLPGVGLAVNRVLWWSGNAGLASDEELVQLPRSVATLLVEYGMPLRVAKPSEESQ